MFAHYWQKFFVVLSIINFLNVSGSVGDDEYAKGEWRRTLDNCWTDSSCNRVMTCAHGGEWNVTFPYDSFPAMEQAFNDGADAVKGDFRVAKDNIGVVMHSSPIEFYESLNCYNKYVEEMTSEECSKCQMELTKYTFMTVPDFLSWADNKINVMFCVKKATDIPRAITTLIENNASHRAFLELHVNDLLNVEIQQFPYWDQVYYVAELGGSADVQRMVSASETMRKRAFLLEFNSWDNWDGNIDEDIALAKSYGFRTFGPTRDSAIAATVQNHLKLYHTGIQVAYTYNLTNAVIARKTVNEENGISPA